MFLLYLHTYSKCLFKTLCNVWTLLLLWDQHLQIIVNQWLRTLTWNRLRLQTPLPLGQQYQTLHRLTPMLWLYKLSSWPCITILIFQSEIFWMKFISLSPTCSNTCRISLIHLNLLISHSLIITCWMLMTLIGPVFWMLMHLLWLLLSNHNLLINMTEVSQMIVCEPGCRRCITICDSMTSI